MRYLKKISALFLLTLVVCAFSMAQSADGNLQKPEDIQDRGINEFVSQVFSNYYVVLALQFDLETLEAEIAAAEQMGSFDSQAQKDNIQKKLTAFSDSWVTLSDYVTTLREKLPVVEEAVTKLHPETEIQKARENLNTCKKAMDVSSTSIESLTAETEALQARVNSL